MNDGTGDRLAAAFHRPTAPSGKPLAILIHGLTGCEDSTYMLASARHLLTLGHPVLRLNLRGAGPSRPLCREQYHAGRSEDLRAALAALDPGLCANGIVLVGYSLGANMMLKYLGEEGPAAPAVAAVAVSAPIDLKATQRRVMAPRNALYHRHILGRMKADILAAGEAVEPALRERATAAESVYAFDDVFVAPRNGFGDAETYYRACSAQGFLPDIRVPTLVIHAMNDPWIPNDAYRDFPWRDNPFLRPLLPAGGGHVGFHGDCGPPAWHDRCIVAFLDGVVG
ncbi:MAG: alpha/beta fold hydrolase [Inquilinus sp.]|nr:alpha/beta fold hydrolase [Inquilinus sp.]